MIIWPDIKCENIYVLDKYSIFNFQEPLANISISQEHFNL